MDASEELFVTLSTRVRICYQTFGDPSNPAVVLISGHSGSMLGWHEDMIKLFNPASGPQHYIIRFDNRDTGLSTEFPVPGGYTLEDMAGDIEGLVDHLGLPSVGFHIVGLSMGGHLASILAARRRREVRSLTLLYASPGTRANIPLNETAFSLNMGVSPMPTGTVKDRESYIEYGMQVYDALTTQPDEDERSKAKAGIARGTERDMRGKTLYSKGPNHGAAAFGGWPWLELLKEITCPTTVIQAAKDQFFGVEHGQALVKEIQNAEYVLWENVGHELPRRVWGQLAETLLRMWKKGDDEWVKDEEIKK